MLDTNQEHVVAEMAAMGKPQTEIAKTVGVSQPSISRTLKEPEIIKKIDEIASKIHNELLDKSYDNIRHVVDNYQTTDSKEEKEHGFKASESILKGVGLFPSAVTSIYIQNSFNQQTAVLSPIVQKLLESNSSRMKELLGEEEDVIEGEIVSA